MSVGLANVLPENPNPGEILDYMSRSPYDELIEIQPEKNSFRTVYHIDSKYYMPSVGGNYQDFYEYVLTHLVHPEDKEAFAEKMKPGGFMERMEKSASPGILDLYYRVRARDRDWRWVEQILVGGRRHGLPENTVNCYIFDIQNIKDREKGVYTVSESFGVVPDPLTGLLSKKDFFLETEKIQLQKTSRWIMVAIDLENFKLFNEWYGWETGDLVLAGTGACLEKIAKDSGGLAGYLDDDDFCLFVPEDAVDIQALYDEIHGIMLQHGASVGFLPSFGISRSSDKFSMLNLFDQASLACGKAKENFKNRIRYFSPDMLEKTEKEYLLLSEFQKALADHEITFYLQPQCRAATGDIVGAEALARWIKSDGTRLPPAMFVPLLEKYGFVTDLDKFIWEEVACWLHNWIEKGGALIPVSVNVSQIDIFTINVPDYFCRLIRKYQLPWNSIKIEITESACAEDSEKVRDVVRELRSHGFLVLMDDFGSGYSSLNMLHELEVDAIKLDARFLHLEKSNEEKGIHILESVVNMAKTMGLPIIVEGVESLEQRDFLMHLGCRYIQGYFFYRPMEISSFEQLVSKEEQIDLRGFQFKSNEEFHVREFLDETVYSDSMLNTILGPVAIYAWHDDSIDIIRFNEQFYEAVNVPDFHDRLNDIGRFMPREDLDLLVKVLKTAMEDFLNGASAMLRFYRIDGGVSRFLIHFYYLGEEGSMKRFYGSARDVTQITILQNHMELISRFFSECIIFLLKKQDNKRFQVAAQGLEDLGLTRTQVETELNSGAFFERIVPEHRAMLNRQCMDALLGIDFSSYFSMFGGDGKRHNLFMKTDYVNDDTSDVRCMIIISRKQSER